MSAAAFAQQKTPAAPTTVILGTATPGGGFPVYGAAVVDVVNAADAALSLQPKNTKGSTENVPLLEAGQLDIGLVQGEVVHDAFEGIGRAPANLRIIAAMYSTPGMFVVRADSPYRSIVDLKGKPVAFGAKGSGLVILARYVLDGIGLDQNRDFQAIYLERAGDGPAMVADGRVAALWGAGLGWPGFAAVAKAPGGARFVGPNAEETRHILAKHSFLRAMTVPAGSYPGQAEADRLGRLLELHPGAAGPARRGRLSPRARAASERSRARRAPAAGARDYGCKHARGRTAQGPDPPGRVALSARNRAHAIARRNIDT